MSDYWINNFNTDLEPENEKRFQAWLKEGKEKYGVDLSKDIENYDLRGFWLNGGYEDEAFRQRKGHAPDTFKKPNHPTFSNESIYDSIMDAEGQVYKGGEWIDEETFKPSKKMLQETHTPDWYLPYMEKYHKGLKILIENEELPFGVKSREPYPSEKDYFKNNIDVTGMATEDNKVIYNQFSELSEEEKEAVGRNEAARIRMRDSRYSPKFKLTREQRNFLDSTQYKDASPEDRAATIAARIFSGDPSGGKPTKEQLDFINKLYEDK